MGLRALPRNIKRAQSEVVLKKGDSGKGRAHGQRDSSIDWTVIGREGLLICCFESLNLFKHPVQILRSECMPWLQTNTVLHHSVWSRRCGHLHISHKETKAGKLMAFAAMQNPKVERPKSGPPWRTPLFKFLSHEPAFPLIHDSYCFVLLWQLTTHCIYAQWHSVTSCSLDSEPRGSVAHVKAPSFQWRNWNWS